MNFKVSEVMTRGVESISPAVTLDQAAKKMRTHNVGILPVVEDEQILGVITDRDIVLRAVSEGMRPCMTRVRDVMTPKAITCTENQSLTEAALVMERRLVHRLIVVDKDQKLAGIVSLSDVAAKTHKEALSGYILGKVSVA
jgi:CBS domain-containing protein